MPEAFSDVRRLTEQLGDAAVERVALHVDPKKLREPIAMLADTRYVLAAVATPVGGRSSIGRSWASTRTRRSRHSRHSANR